MSALLMYTFIGETFTSSIWASDDICIRWQVHQRTDKSLKMFDSILCWFQCSSLPRENIKLHTCRLNIMFRCRLVSNWLWNRRLTGGLERVALHPYYTRYRDGEKWMKYLQVCFSVHVQLSELCVCVCAFSSDQESYGKTQGKILNYWTHTNSHPVSLSW